MSFLSAQLDTLAEKHRAAIEKGDALASLFYIEDGSTNTLSLTDVLVRVGERNTIRASGDGDPWECERQHPKHVARGSHSKAVRKFFPLA